MEACGEISQKGLTIGTTLQGIRTYGESWNPAGNVFHSRGPEIYRAKFRYKKVMCNAY